MLPSVEILISVNLDSALAGWHRFPFYQMNRLRLRDFRELVFVTQSILCRAEIWTCICSLSTKTHPSTGAWPHVCLGMALPTLLNYFGNFLAVPTQTDPTSEGLFRPTAPLHETLALRPSLFLTDLILIFHCICISCLCMAMSWVKSSASIFSQGPCLVEVYNLKKKKNIGWGVTLALDKLQSTEKQRTFGSRPETLD